MSATEGVLEIRISVRGAVQGVGYRWFAREAAARLGVVGWVRNLPDGSVEVEARGVQSAVDAFVETLREGPPHAVVRDLHAEPPASSGTLRDHFTILR